MANQSPPSDNCAVDSLTGQLKDADDIDFYVSETDNVTIAPRRINPSDSETTIANPEGML